MKAWKSFFALVCLLLLPALAFAGPLDGSITAKYIVRSGDTLTGIASDHRCFSVWREIAALSNIDRADHIVKGQEIVLHQKCVTSSQTLTQAKKQEPTSSYVPRTVREMYADTFHWKHVNENAMCGISVDDQLQALIFNKKIERERLVNEIERGNGISTVIKTGDTFLRLTERDLSVRFRTGTRRNAVVDWDTNVLGNDGKPLNTGKLYPATWLSRGVYILVIDRCCNIAIVDRETGEALTGRLKPQAEPPVVAETPLQKKESRAPPLSITPTQGTCVPRSRPQDCAMPGCVLGNSHDAMPACAASYESAPVQNSEPSPETGVVPLGGDEEDAYWTPRPNRDRGNGRVALEDKENPAQIVLCSVGLLSVPNDLHAVCAVEPNACLMGKLICPNPNTQPQ